MPENMLFKKEYEELKAKFSKPDGQEMQPHEVPGYYTRKIRYPVNTVNDFIMKMRKSKVCEKFFKQNDLNYGGLTKVFQKLYDVSRNVL